MKPSVFLAFLLFAFSVDSHAQQGLYVTGGIGYAIPTAGQSVDGSGNPYSGSVNMFPTSYSSNAYTVKKASFTAGFNSRLGVGYMFSGHVGVELSGIAILAPKHYAVNEVNVPSPAGSELVDATVKNYAQLPIFMVPAIVYSTGGKKFSGYARAGLALPLSSNVEREENNVHQTANESTEYLKEEFKMNFGMGIAGAMGVSYKVADNASIWLEGNFLMLSLYVKSEKVVTHTYDDENSTVPPIAGTVTTFGYSGTYVAQSPSYSVPFSNVGISAGIRINFAHAKASGKK